MKEDKTINKGKNVLCFLLALIAVTCAVVMLFYDYHWQDTGVAVGPDETDVPANVQVEPQKDPVVLEKFESIHEKYEDAVGYLSIPDTGVQYYVFQSDDDAYYLTHNRDGKKSSNGEIFMDYRCDIQKVSRRLIIYGHNMRNNSMFGSLDKFKKQSFWEKNQFIDFDTLYGCYQWQIFSVQIANIDVTGNDIIRTDFGSDDEWYQYISNCQKASIYSIPAELKKSDVVLTLSTCTYEFDDARLLIHAKLVR